MLKGNPRRRKYSCLRSDPDAKMIGSIPIPPLRDFNTKKTSENPSGVLGVP
jgi:hypothetical protein